MTGKTWNAVATLAIRPETEKEPTHPQEER